MSVGSNHYEKAFVGWLGENRIPCVCVDQQKRSVFSRSRLKSFDLIVYSRNAGPIIVEVKGRKFDGVSLAGLRGLQNWVTLEDVQGMGRWERVFASMAQPADAVFVFAYWFSNIDVETDGREVYHFDNEQYLFLAVRLADYCRHMTRRSRRWRTVAVSAEQFRKMVSPMDRLFL